MRLTKSPHHLGKRSPNWHDNSRRAWCRRHPTAAGVDGVFPGVTVPGGRRFRRAPCGSCSRWRVLGVRERDSRPVRDGSYRDAGVGRQAPMASPSAPARCRGKDTIWCAVVARAKRHTGWPDRHRGVPAPVGHRTRHIRTALDSERAVSANETARVRPRRGPASHPVASPSAQQAPPMGRCRAMQRGRSPGRRHHQPGGLLPTLSERAFAPRRRVMRPGCAGIVVADMHRPAGAEHATNRTPPRQRLAPAVTATIESGEWRIMDGGPACRGAMRPGRALHASHPGDT